MGIVQAPLIQDGAAQRRGKMRQKHFIKIAVFKEIDFGILTDVLDQLLHLVRQTRIEAFVKKIIIQVTEEIAQQISEENDFADRIQLLRIGCDFSKNLLRQIQKFLVDLSRIGLFHQLAASRDAITWKSSASKKSKTPADHSSRKSGARRFLALIFEQKALLLIDELHKRFLYLPIQKSERSGTH